MKCLNCGEEHYSTSRSCKVWKRAKDIITIKYHESLSFAEARKIVDARQALGVSHSSVTKSNAAKAINLKDAQTQTNDASVQTDSFQQHTITSAKPQKSVVEQLEKPVRNKSPNKSSNKVHSDRLPKGSDDQIQQHNRFQIFDEEDMDADINNAEPPNTNKQGRIIKKIIRNESILTSTVVCYLSYSDSFNK